MEEHRNHMNSHILSAFPSKPKACLLACMAFFLMLPLVIPSSMAQQDQSITITTPKNNYGPGDTVTVTGSVSGGTPGQLVAIQVKDPKGNLILIRTVQTDQNGNFALTFKVPETASAGNFNITASSRVNGYVVTQSTAIAAAVPEFPVSGLVLAAGVALLLVFSIMLSSVRFGSRPGFGVMK